MKNVLLGPLFWLRGFVTPSKAAWKGATRALWVVWLFMVILLFATDVATKFSISRAIGFGAFVATYTLIGIGAALGIYLVSLIKPTYRLAFLAVILPVLLAGLIVLGMPGGLLFTVPLLVMVSLIFGSLNTLRDGSTRGLKRVVTFVYLGLGLVILIGFGYMLVKPYDPLNPVLEDYVLEDWTLDLEDPGATGSFKVSTLSYGSGTDPHRSEYGSEVSWTSPSVDGSKMIDHWDGLIGWVRTKYWGFDATDLPLQGRIWMPEGEGPFPLILIVHGNHSMEDFSDPGYDYLGEHLASRGYIFVSVDENFLNGSTANMIDPRYMGLGEENDARGWMLLEHLGLWRDWNNDAEHPMSGKVDMDRIALMGHSRGGEAVAVAAAFDKLDFYPDDATIRFDYKFNIRAYLAIAPADGQYMPREVRTELTDINYFVIHGAMDGDVSSFMGSSQYSRVKFTPGSNHTKASLYVAGANHGQFNTSWGIHDTGLPYGWLLNTGDIMPAEDQRQIARVYFTAFLETALNNQDAYLPLFSDARYGANWLPQNFYINNMNRASTTYLATFDDDLNPGSGDIPGTKIEGRGLTKWRESMQNLKWSPLDSMVAILGWDEEVGDETAEFEIRMAPGSVETNANSKLVFSASAIGEDTKPSGWEAPDEDPSSENTSSKEEDEASPEEEEVPEPLDWTIVVVDAGGNEARLALSSDQPLYPQLHSQTSRLPMLSTNKSSEMVMRRFTLPLSGFLTANPDLDPQNLVSIKFVFDKERTGIIAVDDIGFE